MAYSLWRAPAPKLAQRFPRGLVTLLALAAAGHAAPPRAPVVYVGGVAGVAALAEPANSAGYRAAGGGLYLHNSGWALLTPEQKRATLQNFAGVPVALELGFGTGEHAKEWGKLCRRDYLDHGIRPVFIAANAFAQNNQPTAEQWGHYLQSLRAAGVPESTLILPTFEYPNFRPNIPTLAQNHVSASPVFQAILRAAGGIVLDTPSGYFFGREPAYRDWVVDALRWTRAEKLRSVVIASPHFSKLQFAADTDRYLEFLRREDVLPDIVVIENYEPKPAPGYPNHVGHEREENSTLGVAFHRLRSGQLAPASEVLLLDNGATQVGLGRSRGGSITWLSWSAHPGNIVNHADPGRLIQQSYYAGRSLDRRADGQSKAWSPWTWNPIQGGGVGSWARVTELALREDRSLFAETVPRLWDMPGEEAAARLRQWTAFEPGAPEVVVVRCELVCQRAADDRWGPAVSRPQEVPACYFVRQLSDVRSYLGDGQWRRESQPPGPPWGKARPPRAAMACFGPDGQGVAVFSPAATQPWNFGPHAGGASADPAAGPCMHVAPIDRAPLGPTSVYRYRYWLVVGDERQIAARLDALWTKYAAERAELRDGP